MKYLSRTAMACFIALLAGNGINACELPAHPNAAAMPVSITPKGGTETPIAKAAGVKLISDASGNFYYLIPEGSKIKMKIVWDPLCHNSGATGKDWDYKKEQYDYLADGHIEGVKPDTEVQAAGGYKFFPLSAMSEFFKVSGNRNDIEEAFGREMKVSTDDKMVPDKAGIGPASLYTNTFSKASTELVIKLTGKKSDNYKDESCSKAIAYNNEYLNRPVLEEYDKTESLNSALPGTHMNLNVGKVYLLDNGKLKLQKFDNGTVGFSAAKLENTEDLIAYSNSGLEVRNISIALKTPKYEDYKAYIAKNANDKEIHVEGIDYNSDKPIATGKDNGYFNVVFTTPSIDGNENDDNAILKIRVNSPAAGYEMNNVFWVWKEQYYERVKEDKKYTVEGDDEVTEINPSTDTGYLVYKKKDGVKKCSCETMVTFNKAQDAFGYSGYKIYDNCGPISTSLVVNDNKESAFEENDAEGKATTTTFNYRISLVDSNPFIDRTIVATSDEQRASGDISQNLDKMSVTFFYNYPVYDYKPKTINKIDDLEGCGLVDFADNKESGNDSNFKTYYHDVSWYWKKAVDVKVNSIKLNEQIKADSALDSKQRLIGSVSTIEGSFTINNPKPWHVTDDNPSGAGESNFVCFAVIKDTAGNTHVTDVFTKNSTDKPLATANPENISGKYALYPVEGGSGELPANLNESSAPYFANDLKSQVGWDGSKWQEMKTLVSKDTTAPEIQIVIFDTRTNRYHIFGTKDNVAAGLNNFQTTSDTDYAAKINSVPYIGRNTIISNTYSYTGLVDVNSLYDTYLKGDTDGNAVSTVKDSLNKNGFVCQKGTRLVFYVHAFDNIGYDAESKKYGGVEKVSVDLVDYDGKSSAITLKDNNSFENVFRQENYDKEGNLKAGMNPYKIIVTAQDKVTPTPNERKFELDIGVVGRTLDLRTLEEKRERVK